MIHTITHVIIEIVLLYGFVYFFSFTSAQWIKTKQFLTKDKIFIQTSSEKAYNESDYFVIPSTHYDTANFITCTTQSMSYITLTSTFKAAQYYNSISLSSSGNNIYFVTFDLYFQGLWNGESVIFSFGTYSETFYYTSPMPYPILQGFCDSIQAGIKTVEFSMSFSSSSGQLKFSSFNTNTGKVSIRNIQFFYLQCFPSCLECSDQYYNQCTKCYYGTPSGGVCPSCPSDKPFSMKYLGCKTCCKFDSQLYSDGFCQYFTRTTFVYSQFVDQSEINKWSLIYDPAYIDTTPNSFINPNNYYFYGLFTYHSGIYRYVKEVSYQTATYAISLHIDIGIQNPIPLGCGIQFYLNNSYYGSITNLAGQLQTHRIQFYDQYPLSNYLTYTNCYYYELYLNVDIPPYPFIFSAVGNYTDATAAWSLKTLEVSSGYCPSQCSLCEVSFKCKTCQSGYYLSRDYTCSSCSNSYQKLNSSNFCVDFDDETEYSKFSIEEYTTNSINPNQYSQYTLLSQNGINFMKGSNIYYSLQNNYEIFGGQYVWAQAKFSRDHLITDPHHSVTISFNIVYGPSFPSDSSFIYTIDNATPVTTRESKTYNKIQHSSTTTALNMQWECFGPNNEPINAFCGFYNYYISVHYCQPYCLSCSDQYTCNFWNSTYDSNIIKFSQSDCLTNQYFNKDISQCISCPSQCLTCTSAIDCLSCVPTYYKTKLGCTCTMHQYEIENQCEECPIECSQCISGSYCIECLSINNRVLNMGECNCFEGYYSMFANPVCLACHKYCKTCTGPSNSDCTSCNMIQNIVLTGTICDCTASTIYLESSHSCIACHPTCLTCFATTFNGCLACNATSNRTLKGLKCECQTGYYESSSVCILCPSTEDSTLVDCYKQCQSLIWNTILCNTCDSEYQLINGECIPICGDGVIAGDEECDDMNSVLDDGCFNCKFQCPQQCTVCDATTTFPCQDICGDALITGQEECDDGNYIPFDGCYNCKYQCQPQCTKCILGKCYECVSIGYYVDPTTDPWLCKPKCGDGLIVGDEQCDDQNNLDDDGCKDCKYFCMSGCKICNTFSECLECSSGFTLENDQCVNICGDGIIVTDPNNFYTEQCDDGNTVNSDGCSSDCQYQCQVSSICTDCSSNICYSCAPGYVLNRKNNICDCQSSCDVCSIDGFGCLRCQKGYAVNNSQCFSICGDGIVTTEEQCDDENLIYNDGCHFCKQICQDSCRSCILGQCYNCASGYFLELFMCFPIIESQLLISDKCPVNCKNCSEFKCLDCIEGYYGEDCTARCGDNIIAGEEQCDDGKSSQLDGCTNNCYFKCDNQCTTCMSGVCYYCKQGFYLDILSNSCHSICGDKIVTYDELCDDGNQTSQDGCHMCQYDCIENCSDCQFGNCISCQNSFIIVPTKGACEEKQVCDELQGLYYDNLLNICFTKCGDGIIAGDEFCDDGPAQTNLCVDCQECSQGSSFNDYKCQPICGGGNVVQDQPEFKIDILASNIINVQEVQITFTQQMKFNFNVSTDIASHILTTIADIERSKFNISYFANITDAEVGSDLVIIITIIFYDQVESPILEIAFIDDPFISINDQPLKNNKNSIILPSLAVLNDHEINIAQASRIFTNIVIYILVGVSLLSLLTKSSDLFWNLLDQLQYISYIKYVNIQFPNNINIYFEVFKMITISPFVSAMKLDKLLSWIDGEKNFRIEPSGKFSMDGVNAYFLINFSTFIISVIGVSSLYIIAKWGTQLLYRFATCYEQRFNFFATKILFKLIKLLQQYFSNFFYNGLLRIVMSNYYDITFAVAIQLAYPGKGEVVFTINYYCALVMACGQFGFIMFTIRLINNFMQNTTTMNRKRFNILLENILKNNSIWSTQYNSILLIKKQLFIFILVFMQQNGPIQTLLIALLQTFFLLYLLYNQPLQNRFEFYKNIITDCLIISNAMVFVVYECRVELGLSLSQYINIGWFQITIFCSILVASLGIDFTQQAKVIIEKIQLHQQRPIPQIPQPLVGD